ncbi:hypothetical protein GALL_502510 [mine drainage metagenome]|uniref:Uncharacterized protein n=1 Tax=mine drainage metagenome TaxID=410659 RepID=A0A1J5P975_9ZZZZ
MLDHGHPGLHVGQRVVVLRTAVERRKIAVQREGRGGIKERTRSGRRIAPVGHFLVVIEFVAQLDPGVVIRLQRDGRIESEAFQVSVIAEGIASFVERIQTHGDVVVDSLAGIERNPAIAIGSRLHARVVDPGAVGFLEGAIDHAAPRSAPEHQRGGTFQHFKALRVIDIPVILNVVAKAVDEEIRAGIDAANDEFVAVALALMHRHAWNVPRQIGDAVGALVLNEILGQNADRLRDVQQRRVGLGPDRRAVGVIPVRSGAGALRHRELFRRRGRLGPARRLRPALCTAARGAQLSRKNLGAAPDFRGGNHHRRQRISRYLLRSHHLRPGFLRAGQYADRDVADRDQHKSGSKTDLALERTLHDGSPQHCRIHSGV